MVTVTITEEYADILLRDFMEGFDANGGIIPSHYSYIDLAIMRAIAMEIGNTQIRLAVGQAIDIAFARLKLSFKDKDEK